MGFILSLVRLPFAIQAEIEISDCGVNSTLRLKGEVVDKTEPKRRMTIKDKNRIGDLVHFVVGTIVID